MKRKFFLIMFLLVSLTTLAQTFQKINIELDSVIPKDKTVVYEASNSLKLFAGVQCEPEKNKSVMFKINRFGVFPPDEGVIGGPPSSDRSGVVGALPGELNVNDMGAAVYSMPVMVPKGVGDLTPELAVTYNNQSGNGLLGWGWNISGLSSIVRVGKTQYHDGTVAPVNFVDDRFSLDGKRLMLCSETPSSASYKTEVDEMNKVVAYKDTYNGPSRFKVYKKDGSIWEYGFTDDSKIEAQNHNNVVLTWLVNKISDREGNSIIFNYHENQNTGEHYIDRIEYTSNDKVGISPMFAVEFVYDERDDLEFGYVFGNLVQSKRLLHNVVVRNIQTGSILYDYSFEYIEPGNYSDDVRFMYCRLSSIGLTANGMKLNNTKINWNKKSHYSNKFLSYTLDKSVFNKVPFVGDFNGDGYSDVLTVPYKIGNSYTSNVSASIYLNNGDGTFATSPCHTIELDQHLEWVYVVDFDGDGLDDVIAYYANADGNSWRSKMVAFMNRGSTFNYVGMYSSDRFFSIYPGDFCGEKKVSFFLEYNNNGQSGVYYPKIVYFKDGELHSQALGQSAYANVPERVVVEDVNGDGCSEIIYLLSNCSVINGLSFSNSNYSFMALCCDDNITSEDYLFPGDFNGDGYTDFLRYNNRTYWKMVYSDGKKFQTPVSCLNNNLLRGLTLVPQDRYYCSLENLARPSVSIRTADFDGDGKTDVGVFSNNGGNYYAQIGFKVCKVSDNSCDFGDIRRFYFNINYSHQYVYVGNFLGKENASILSSVRMNPYSAEYPKIVSLNPHTSKYSVERITDGLGNIHGLKYEYVMPYKANMFYSFGYESLDNNIRSVALPMKALFADTVYSADNNPCVTKYSYRNALYHKLGHGLLGFERISVKTLINNTLRTEVIVEKTPDIMGDKCLLLINRISKYNNNLMVQGELYDYENYICSQNEKVVIPLVSIKKRVYFDFDMAGSIFKTNIENFEYKSDGTGNYYNNIVNIRKYKSGYDDNYTGDDASSCDYCVTTDYEYNNNIPSWIVERISKIRQSQRYDDNEAVGTCDIIEYDGSESYKIKKKTSLPNVNMNFSDPLKTITEYSYDVAGNMITQSVTSPSSKNQRVKRYEYASQYNYRLPTSIVNENGWTSDISYTNDYCGNVTTVDYNGFTTECDSDPFEIFVEKTLPGGLKNVLTKRWANDNGHSPNGALYYYWEKTSGEAESLSFYNKQGQKIRDVTFGLDGDAIYVDMTYDDMGNMTSKSMPYVSGEDVRKYYYVYDNYNRLIEEIFPNGLTKNYTYSNLQTTISTVSPDGHSHVVVEVENPMGWRELTEDIGGNIIHYDYYSDGKLKSAMIGDDAHTKVEYEYDNRRNMVKMKDPACGEVSYEYNAFGELIGKTTPRQYSIMYSYDNLGNILTCTESNAKGNNTISTQWIYDNQKGKVGTLSQIVCGDTHAVSYDYDDMLRVVGITEIINGNDYFTAYSYDNANREEVIVYPTGVSVRKYYSNTGIYKSLTDLKDQKILWQTKAMNASGYVVDYQLGNGLVTNRSYYEDTNMLSEINTKREGKVYQDLTYAYDAFGNLVNRSKHTGFAKSESFVYDDFNRLVEINMNNKFTGGMTYDDYGNVLSKINDGADVFYDASYEGSCPYAVNSIKIDNEGLYGINQTVDYTSFDKISSMCCENNSLSIDYGFNHERVHSFEIVAGHQKEKTYVADCEYVIDNGRQFAYTFLEGPMGVFAVCVTDENGCESICYVHKDHLDSWCLVTDVNGDVMQEVSFDAWGNPRNANTWTGTYNGTLFCDRGFTGHEHLSSFGVINMNGRAYDPVLSMMMSPDEFIQNPDFSQNYNRYSYCYNNPLSYSDPSGEWVEWLLYGLFNGAVNIICNMDYLDSFQEGALSFGAGFVNGCLTQGLVECWWAVQVAGNVAGSVLTSGVNDLVKKNTNANIDFSILETEDFRNNFMYNLGSSLATSVLTTNFNHTTNSDEGICLGTLLCSDKVEQTLLENSAGKMAGNLFSGKNIFDGFNISKSNWTDIIPYVKCVADVCNTGVEFTGQSTTLGNLFDQILNFDAQGMMSNFGDDMNYCYSHIRSLFLKI